MGRKREVLETRKRGPGRRARKQAPFVLQSDATQDVRGVRKWTPGGRILQRRRKRVTKTLAKKERATSRAERGEGMLDIMSPPPRTRR